MKFYQWIFIAGWALFTVPAVAQNPDQTQAEEDMYSLSLEELMNIPINSASRKDETLFDAPLSSYTITKADIERSGATSIMDALRLAPGVIVREQTNGVYDIHIRGFDNLGRTTGTNDKTNTAALVMIDNRPVFNHNLGGTAWEALPIDLNDVERIEIVRGPSAPLFGPNAVTGVINIITRRAGAGTFANANVQYGTPNTLIANGGFGTKLGEKFSLGLSANYQKREKYDDKYFNSGLDGFFTLDEIETLTSGFYPPFIPSFEEMYPNAETSLNKWGVNAQLGVAVNDNVSFDLQGGLQDAQVQKIFLGGIFDGMAFTTNETSTQYANLSGKVHGLTFRASFLTGKDDLSVKQSPNKYDYTIADAVAEYNIHIGNRVSIVPGVSYQDVKYSDEDYASELFTFLGGQEQTINTLAGFIRSDINIVKNWRVIAALRVDKFSSHDDAYLAYELATTYKLNEQNLVRAAITRSNSGSFIGYNYLNFVVPDAGGPGFDLVRTGTEGLDLLTIDMVELGFRSQLTSGIQLDLDVFQQKAKNLTAIIVENQLLQAFGNIPTTATQTGVTASINIVPNARWQFKPFITVQSTETKDLPSSFIDPAVDPSVTYSDSKHKNTPTFFGGYYLNFQPISKLNINTSGYYFGKQTQYDDSDNEEAGAIDGKLLVNIKLNYAITPQFNMFVNGRNIFGSDSREYFGGDTTPALWLAGASFKLN